jgi:hypothetical protein
MIIVRSAQGMFIQGYVLHIKTCLGIVLNGYEFGYEVTYFNIDLVHNMCIFIFLNKEIGN